MGQQRLDQSYLFHYIDLQPLGSAEEFYDLACQLITGEPGRGYDGLRTAIEGKKVVLCLDEFERSVEADFGAEFFEGMRGLDSIRSLRSDFSWRLQRSGRCAVYGYSRDTHLCRVPDYAELFSNQHELFHRIQPGLGLITPTGNNAHLDTIESRIWLRLEWRALARALAQSGDDRKRAVSDAAAFRLKRRSQFAGAAENERSVHFVIY